MFYNGFYSNYGFVQVFYPTRGVLAWYSRESGKLQPLPGADDPEYVQACAFWSPDGRYLVFSRAKARDPYPPGQPPPATPTIPTKPRFSTTSTASRSTTARAAKRSGSPALRKTA
jgi:hypothetical protein